MSEVTIRRAVAADAALLAELGARTFTEAFGADNRPEDLASHLAATYGTAQQAAELADARATYLVADGAGHNPHHEQPELCAAGLRTWIDAVLSSTA